MSYAVLPFKDFAGLDLTNSPDQSACVDLLNVDLDRRGAVRSRDGYASFTSSAAATRYDNVWPFYTSRGTRQLLASRGRYMDALNTSGGVIATVDFDTYLGGTTDADSQTWDVVRLGTPTTELAYMRGAATAGGGVVNIGASWDGSVFANPAAIGELVTIQTTDNRLVAARDRLLTHYSRVQFSDPGDPTTFGADNYVDLAPGDGEEITALASWREGVYVFKPSRFFVFYGTSTDATGGAEFNYRPVDAGVGPLSARGIATSPNALYFAARTGIYVTTGGNPELISDAISPIFQGSPSSFFQSSPLNQGAAVKMALHWHDERLYFSYPSGSSTTCDRMFVYDPRYGYWTLFDIPAAGMNTFRIGDREELVFAYASGADHVGRHSSSYTTDAGTAITSRYRSGFYDLGSEEQKQLPRTRVWGTGNVSYSMSRDFGSLGTAETLSLGTSPVVGSAESRSATNRSGRTFSHQLAATSAWSVQRLHQEIQGQRPVTAQTD